MYSAQCSTLRSVDLTLTLTLTLALALALALIRRYALGSKGSTRRKLATAAGCIIEYVGRLACICGAYDYLGLGSPSDPSRVGSPRVRVHVGRLANTYTNTNTNTNVGDRVRC